MDDNDDGDASIYNDLPEFRYDETIDKLNATIAKLEAENKELHSKLTEMKKEKEILEKNCSVLSTNISSLLKTSKLEIQRKERTINDLRQEVRNAASQSRTNGVKRHYENMDYKNQNAEIKSTYKRYSQGSEPTSKKPRFSESDRPTDHPVSRNENSVNGNMGSVKPLPKMTHTSQKENVPLTSSHVVTNLQDPDTIPKIAAPSLPIIDCPTVFSARMYQRLYNTSATRTVAFPSPPLVPANGEEPLLRVCEERSSDQQTLAIESEKKVPKIPDDAVKLPSNLPFSQKSLIPITATVQENERSTSLRNDSSVIKSKLNTCLVSSSEKVVSENVNESPLPSSKKCAVDEIHPGSAMIVNQPLTVSAEGSRVHLKESQDQIPKSKKRTPTPKKKSKLIDTNCAKLKLRPRLKGKSFRKNRFAPISNAWSSLKPPVPAHEKSVHNCQQSENTLNKEMCSVASCVTSEITVKIDEERVNDKGKLVLDVFGSPVKWADDCSSDADKVEGHAAVSGKKLYSIFGSPYKNGDSVSSEPGNFILPPSAYEDSCWTSQPPDKASPRSNKAPTPSHLSSSSSLVASRDKSSESTSGSNDRDNETKPVSLPPPAHPIGKKNQSIFSPSKDSKTATTLPSITVDDRSTTGICFPFKTATRYEDSVLGQFDDTIQFVSALANVESKISPLSTPNKTPELNGESKTCQLETINSSLINNPTSFKEVFQNKAIQDGSKAALTGTSVMMESKNTKSFDDKATNSVSMESSLGIKKINRNEDNVCDGDEIGKSNASSKVVDTHLASTSKFIHRSNFSSSSVFTMSSDSQSFVDKPLNVLKPRKTPRVISNTRSPAPSNGSCKDVKLNPRIAIADAFITEQEERVRQWQKNHLYETTLKSSTAPKMPSPSKSQVKMHCRDSAKAPSPIKTLSTISDFDKNQFTPSERSDTPSSISEVQVKTNTINRLQPKRVPRRPVIPNKSCDGLLKTVTAIVKPGDTTASEPPPRALVADPPYNISTHSKALAMIQSVVDNSVLKHEAPSFSTNDNKKDKAVDVPPNDHVNKKTEPEKREDITSSEPPPRALVDDPPYNISIHSKALAMIQSVVDNSVLKHEAPSFSTDDSKEDKAVDVPPDDNVHKKMEPVSIPVKTEKSTDNIDFQRYKHLATVACRRRNPKFVEGVSLIEPKTPHSSICKPRFSKIYMSSTSPSPVIVTKKPVVIRDCDFKRSSALKKTGDQNRDHVISSGDKVSAITKQVLVNDNISKDDIPSRPKLIRRKSAPNLLCCSQNIETRVTSRTLTNTSSSKRDGERRKVDIKVPNIPIADTTSLTNWKTVPIEMDVPKNIYECITSSFDSKDPRALPRLKIPLIPKDRRDSKKDDLIVKTVDKPTLGHPNGDSPNVSEISRVGEENAVRRKNSACLIVTSTPFPKNRERRSKEQLPYNSSRQGPPPKQQIPDAISPQVSPGRRSPLGDGSGKVRSRPQVLSSLNETSSLKMEIGKRIIITRSKSCAGRMLADAPVKTVKKETRGKKRSTETHPDQHKNYSKEPTKRPRNGESHIIPKPFVADKLAEVHPEAIEVTSTSGTSSRSKSINLNVSSQVCSVTSLSPGSVSPIADIPAEALPGKTTSMPAKSLKSKSILDVSRHTCSMTPIPPKSSVADKHSETSQVTGKVTSCSGTLPKSTSVVQDISSRDCLMTSLSPIPKPSVADKLAETPLANGKSVSVKSPKSKSIVLDVSRQACSMTSLPPKPSVADKQSQATRKVTSISGTSPALDVSRQAGSATSLAPSVTSPVQLRVIPRKLGSLNFSGFTDYTSAKPVIIPRKKRVFSVKTSSD